MRSTSHSSKRSIISFAYVIPCIIFVLCFFLMILTLANTSLTNHYVRGHVDNVFHEADLNHDDFVDYYEFAIYTLSLPQYQNMNTSDFRDRLILIFEDMDPDHDDRSTEDEMYQGVLLSLQPPRRRFGFSLLAICIVTLGFIYIYRHWLKKIQNQEKADLEQGRPLLKNSPGGSKLAASKSAGSKTSTSNNKKNIKNNNTKASSQRAATASSSPSVKDPNRPVDKMNSSSSALASESATTLLSPLSSSKQDLVNPVPPPLGSTKKTKQRIRV